MRGRRPTRRKGGCPLDEQDTLLTLQEAADLLKVHYMTAYRWVRRGDLPAFKTGGRLRLRSADVQTFLEDRELQTALPQDRDGRTDWALHLDRLYELLLKGDEGEATHLVRRVVADGASAGETYLHLLAPALHRIGDAWAEGQITVPVEHRASEIATAVIARMGEFFRRRGPVRGVAVTLTPSGEQHGLAAAMIAHFLRGGGYEVHHLGADVPMEELRDFLGVVPSDVIALSITRGIDRADYGRIAASVRELPTADGGTGPVVVFGGQGVDPEAVAGAGAVLVTDLDQLLATIEGARRHVGAASDDGSA